MIDLYRDLPGRGEWQDDLATGRHGRATGRRGREVWWWVGDGQTKDRETKRGKRKERKRGRDENGGWREEGSEDGCPGEKKACKESIITVRPTQPCCLWPPIIIITTTTSDMHGSQFVLSVHSLSVHMVIKPHHSSPSLIRDARRATAAGGTISTDGLLRHKSGGPSISVAQAEAVPEPAERGNTNTSKDMY